MKILTELFLTFAKVGLFTFGGGYAMLAQIREKIVEEYGWLSDDELTEIIAIAEATPGPIAINMATFVGFKKKGFWGSVFSTLGVVLPSMIIIFIISLFLDEFMENKYVAYAFSGIKCAVAFLIFRACYGMLAKMEKKALPIIVFSCVLACMIAFELFSIRFSSVLFIIIGGIIGIVCYSLSFAKKGDNSK